MRLNHTYNLKKKSNILSLTLMALFVAFFVFSNPSLAQVSTLWEFSQGTSTLPGYFGSGTERGIAFGTIGGQSRLLLSSQTPRILVIDPANGDTLGRVNTTNVTGGTYAVADVEVSSDGIVFAANLTLNSSTTAWKLYKWTDISAEPTVYQFTTTYAARLGDKFTVVGSASDNSLTIFAAHGSTTSSHPTFVLKLTTTDNGATFTATEINVPGYTPGSTASVAPIENGASGFYVTGNGQPIRKFDASGNFVTAVNTNLVLGTGSNAIRYFFQQSRKYLLFFHNGPGSGGTTTVGYYERARIIDVTDSDSLPVAVAATPQLGTASNSNGTGDISIRDNGDGTFTVYVLASNNGIGAYTVDPTQFKLTLPVGTVVNFNSYYLPDNWRRFAGYVKQSPITLTESTSIWVPDDFGNVVATPINRSAKINIYGTGRFNWLVSPSINIPSSEATYKVEFDLALTKYNSTNVDTLGDDDTLAVLISTDNGATWDSSKILKLWKSGDIISNTGQQVTIELTGYSGLVKFGFYGASSVSNKDVDVFVDNFAVKEITVTQVNWCNLQWPGTHTMTAGDQVTVYAQAWIDGVTPTPGASPGLDAWIGISSANTNPNSWNTWVPATFNVDAGNNDEFMAQIGSTLPAGTYYYASRWQYLGGPYRYGGFNGGFWDSLTNISGVLTVNPYTVSTFPYEQGFESTQFPPLGWSVEDLNGGNTWVRSISYPKTGVGHASYPYHGTLPGNDYLFSAGLNLQAGTHYSITYSYRVRSATYAENFAVTIGTAPNFAGVTDTLADHPGVVNITYTTNTATFTPSSTGLYYVGFHAYSVPDMWDLYIDDVVIDIMPLFSVNWENSAGASTLPTWFSATASTERGFGYGVVNTPTEGVASRVVVVSRNGGNTVHLVDDSTGADAGTLDVTGITGGLFQVNDADVGHHGRIFVCNMTTDASNVANPFKVYRWTNTASVPQVVVSFNTATAIRLGDKFKVSWDAATNGVVIWAASSTAGQPLVYKWNQIAGTDSFNQVPTIVTLSDNPTVGASAAVGPLPDGSFYWNSNGQLARKYTANGSIIDTIPGTILATGSNAMEFIGTVGTSEYLAAFQYGTGNQNARVLEIPNNNPELATVYGITPSLGANSNANGTGDVAVKTNPNGSKTIFAMATNNGFGSYTATQNIPVELASFKATAIGGDVLLDWQTSTETNSSFFEVQRKADDKWESIGSVKASGTSTELKNYTYKDGNLNSGKYSYRLRIVDLDGSFEFSDIIEVGINAPIEYSLSQNYPNPFNPSTSVKFAIPYESKVTVQVFSITGELVATIHDGILGSGYHQFEWNASHFATGMYIYRMSAQSLENDRTFNSVKKMMLLK